MNARRTNLSLLAQCCAELIGGAKYNDFWVLAGLTDRSYEEGDRNAAFGLEMQQYESAGLEVSTSSVLRNGINGNLAALIEARGGHLEVTRNKWAGQDLSFEGWAPCSATAEIKLVYDCTVAKCFPSLARDVTKLCARRRSGFIGDLFLIIFFATFPNYIYPAGEWLGKQWESRSRYMRNCGVKIQFAKVISQLGFEPTWPGNDEPCVKAIASPTSSAASTINRLYSKNFKSATPWHFDPKKHLHGG